MRTQGDGGVDPTLLTEELRTVHTALDEVAERRREVLDRYDVLSLALMLLGLAVFATMAALSFSSGQTGRGQVFAGLTLFAVPFVLFAAWTSVGRYVLLTRREGRMQRREAALTTRLATLAPSPLERTTREPPGVPGISEPSGVPAPPSGVPEQHPGVPAPVAADASEAEPPLVARRAPEQAKLPTSVLPISPELFPTEPEPAAPTLPRFTGPNAATLPDARPSVDEAAAMLAAALPAYVVRDSLGQGGCGMVFLAEHRQAGWLRALKLLTETALLPDSQSRFLREAQVMESLDHPHIARVYEYVEYGGYNLIVLEYLPGGSAADRVADLRGRPEPICSLGLGVASALAAAHQRNVVHRDIKPGNLLFADDGTVKVTDFGIAKLLLTDADGEPASILAATPGYAAPEQLTADEITARTDLYGLAATLYRLFSGQTPPMPGADGSPRANMGAIPPQISAVLERSLNGFKERRHPDAMSFALDLAAAAAASLRPGWLDASGVPFRGAPEIRAAATG